MKKRRIFLIVTIVLITILLVVSPAMATATRTEWTEQKTVCEYYCPEGEVCEHYGGGGKIIQARGFVQYNRVLSYNPDTLERITEWDGWITAIQNFDMNLVTGNGTAWGTFVRGYYQIDGTFEGTWSGQIRAGHFTGKVVGQGTGDFEGQIVKGWLNNVLNEDLPFDPPCTPADMWGAVDYGYILDPRGE
jgi:hypothetical protein